MGKRDGINERRKNTNDVENLLLHRTFARFFYIIVIFYLHLYSVHGMFGVYSLEGCGPFASVCKGH